jgi:hypothetical protein
MSIRSILLATTVGILGAAGCVATSDAADESATAQATGGGGALFDCQNKASISGVQCVSLPLTVIAPISVDVKNVGILDGNKLSILNDDLNHLNIGDINILNGNSILSDLVDVTKNDFLNKFNIVVAKNDVCAVVSVLGLGICK